MENQNQPDAAPAPVKPKRAKPQSRSARWASACSDALSAFAEIIEAIDKLDDAIAALVDVKSEYEDWKDNLPENLQSSALGDKLETVCDLDLDDIASNLRSEVEQAQSTIEDAEGLDLPLGFGRD